MACVPEEEPATAWHRESSCQQSTELLASLFFGGLTESGAHWVCGVPAPLGIPEEMSPRGTVLCVTCVPVGHGLGRAGVSDRQQRSECLSPSQDECPLGSGRKAFTACFGFCAKDNQ